jgi:hypothetical protein
MRIIRLFLVSLIFLPLVSNAQDQEFDQTLLVLNTDNFSEYQYDNLSVDCEAGIPFLTREVAGGGTFDLRAVSINRKTGAFIKDRYQVGSMGVCWSVLGDEIEDPVNGTRRPQDMVFSIEVNGTTYGALGTVRGAGYSADLENMWIISAQAILVDIVDGQPGDPVGALTANMLVNNSGMDEFDDGDRLSAIVTLRFFEPENEGNETLAEVLGIGN